MMNNDPFPMVENHYRRRHMYLHENIDISHEVGAVVI